MEHHRYPRKVLKEEHLMMKQGKKEARRRETWKRKVGICQETCCVLEESIIALINLGVVLARVWRHEPLGSVQPKD